MDFSEVGIQVRNARKALRWTQAELGKRSRLSRTTVSQIERGRLEDLGLRKFDFLLQCLGLRLTVAENRRPTLREAYAQKEQEQAEAFRLSSKIINAQE